jgi:hypothetical protein
VCRYHQENIKLYVATDRIEYEGGLKKKERKKKRKEEGERLRVVVT